MDISHLFFFFFLSFWLLNSSRVNPKNRHNNCIFTCVHWNSNERNHRWNCNFKKRKKDRLAAWRCKFGKKAAANKEDLLIQQVEGEGRKKKQIMDQNTNTRIDWRELATEGWISADRLEPFSPGALNARVKMAANREEEVSAWRWWWRGIRLRAQRPGREHDQGPVGGVGTEHFFFGGGLEQSKKHCTRQR